MKVTRVHTTTTCLGGFGQPISLDAVVHSDRDKFWSDVTFYATLSVITGAFGALRNLCVSLVGQRIAKDVRQQLFGAILGQDIAFFDGNSPHGVHSCGGLHE